MKRHSRPETFVPMEAARASDPQLSLPFSGRKPVAAAAPRPAVESLSRRDLRPQEAPRQVRLPRSPEGEVDRVAVALALYLPPGKTLELALTNNHYSMISVRRKTDGYRLRLHRMFVDAEARVVRALARYVVHNDRRASTLLGEYIEEHQHIIRQQERRPRHIRLRTAGRHHDLRAIWRSPSTLRCSRARSRRASPGDRARARAGQQAIGRTQRGDGIAPAGTCAGHQRRLSRVRLVGSSRCTSRRRR